MTRLLLPLALVFLSPLTALAIFYGEDDYVEVDQIKQGSSPAEWTVVARAVAIVIDAPRNGELDLSTVKSLRKSYRKPPLDPDYKYGHQPRLAHLTAFLVAPDKIMTAGHAGVRKLKRSAFIFDYNWDSASNGLRKTRYSSSEIYRCKKVLLHRNDKRGDYAVCQLDRPVIGRKPLKIEVVENASQLDGKQAKMISSPDGSPLKLTDNGKLLGKRPTGRSPNLNLAGYFFHTLDNSGGSSGAPILDAATGRVVGIQSGGDDNFTEENGVLYATRGDFRKSNLGRPLRGEWGSLIPSSALNFVEND